MKNLFIYYLIYIWDRCNAFGVMKIGVMKIGGNKKRQQS